MLQGEFSEHHISHLLLAVSAAMKLQQADVEALEALGFPRERIIAALAAGDNQNDTEAAAQYIIDNEDQPDR